MFSDIQITPEQFIENPHAFFGAARQKSPVLWVEFMGVQGWLVTGHHEVESILKDSRFIKESRRVLPPEHQSPLLEKASGVLQLMRNMMIFRDAPDHTRLRRLVSNAFTPKMVHKLEPMIEDLAAFLIKKRVGHSEHELIRNFSYLLPVMVISELLGVPPEDRDLFRQWAESMFKFIDFNNTPEEMEQLAVDIQKSAEYFQELITARRKSPREDLISGLIASTDEGDRLTDDEMIASSMLLMFAGHETTVNLITNTYYLLLKHPEQYQLVKENLTLVPQAIEEALRYEPPVAMTARWIAEDLEYADQELKKGHYVMLSFAAANRDPEIISDPDRFELTREQPAHLSFSAGPHFCLGASLARLEGKIALEKLLIHLHRPVLLQEPKRRNNISFRGFEHLHLRADVDFKEL